jgi:uncharacterized protein with PhoU and TrkA domain
VEEIHVPAKFRGTTMGELGLRGADYVLLAVRAGDKWLFNPQRDYRLDPGSTIIVMATPGGRQALETLLHA